MANDVGRSAVADGLSSASPMEPQASPPKASIPSAKVWRITSYMPSHKQFSLPANLTPEHITAVVGEPKGKSPDGKCAFQWEFFAERYFENDKGEFVPIALPCAVWDYHGARWSAFGPPEAFREIGLLPASAIEARSDATAQTGAAVGESAGPKDDAPPAQRAEPSNG